VAEAFLKVHPTARLRKAFEDVWKLPWRSVKDGDLLDCGLKAVWTPGHTPSHVVYVANFGVFAGDHVLPKITPNISWHPIPGFNPLREYLQSLRKVAWNTRAFPAHGDEMPDLSNRVAELLSRHERRLADVLKLLKEPTTTYQIAQRMAWDAGPFEQFDVYSHLLYLEEQGAVRRIEKDVVYWTR
jgi:glyoxylase-like metal-dependent hydrolase (beta-lactamase superfamily II)